MTSLSMRIITAEGERTVEVEPRSVYAHYNVSADRPDAVLTGRDVFVRTLLEPGGIMQFWVGSQAPTLRWPALAPGETALPEMTLTVHGHSGAREFLDAVERVAEATDRVRDAVLMPTRAVYDERGEPLGTEKTDSL